MSGIDDFTCDEGGKRMRGGLPDPLPGRLGRGVDPESPTAATRSESQSQRDDPCWNFLQGLVRA